MAHYVEFSYWSPTLGCDATRISMADERGEEYFCILPVGSGAAWRKLKVEALDVLTEAIENELGPGEIRWRVSQ